MNIFVLCTGRCGSVTFIEAAKHISNYSAGHETRTKFTGHARFAYPVQHIEADNRLSWLLGRLDARYGDDAVYVHLQRDILDTAQSFLKRKDRGIMRAYRADILMGADKNAEVQDLSFCIDYCQTIDANIHLFLKDKTRKMNFTLESANSDWVHFWNLVGAEGDFAKSLACWDVRHNAST
jgi:hypothetical protein